MRTPRISRTFGPIHFEDLDPHRFEDLVRELAYDFNDWQSIEATGRAGNDAGFDIRAYERVAETITEGSDRGDSEEERELPHPMEGHLWMIQCKREKEIGPARVRSIVSEVEAENPPYGYILAAPANFSKTSFDTFRDELRKKEVMEFYLWGKAQLEDMLHLPKNDRILFTFFGVSLVSRRRSRSTEVRSVIVTKNKLYRVLGEGQQLHKQVLVRDLNDTHYPYKADYKDFDSRPRWKEYSAERHHPLGLFVNSRRFFAYIDTETKEFDYTNEVDLRHVEVERDEDRQSFHEKQTPVRRFWEFLPRAKQGHIVIDGFIKYEDIVAVDEKGDELYSFPHIFVPFGKEGPFAGSRQMFEKGQEKIWNIEDYKRITIFPKTFPKPKPARIRKGTVVLDEASLKDLKEYREVGAVYDQIGKYSFLEPGDVIAIKSSSESVRADTHIEITCVLKNVLISAYLKQTGEVFRYRRAMQQQLGKDVPEDETVTVYEFKRHYLTN